MSLFKSIITFSFVVVFAGPLIAQTRAWKSADGVRSVNGEFVSRASNGIVIRSANGKEISIELAKLHPDEIKWLDSNHPAGGKRAPTEVAPAPNPNSFFDSLSFEDTRESALARLKASKVVEMTTDDTFVGRTGLNGIFRTRQKVGGLSAYLYFDWTAAGKLKELTIQTETKPAADYKLALEPCWKEFIELLTTLYGKPVQRGSMPSKESIPDGSFFPSHLWNLETRGSALLGTARDGEVYQVVVRFTQTNVKPVEFP